MGRRTFPVLFVVLMLLCCTSCMVHGVMENQEKQEKKKEPSDDDADFEDNALDDENDFGSDFPVDMNEISELLQELLAQNGITEEVRREMLERYGVKVQVVTPEQLASRPDLNELLASSSSSSSSHHHHQVLTKTSSSPKSVKTTTMLKKDFFIIRDLMGVGSTGLFRHADSLPKVDDAEKSSLWRIISFWTYLLPFSLPESSSSSKVVSVLMKDLRFRVLALAGDSWGLFVSRDSFFLSCMDRREGREKRHAFSVNADGLVGQWMHVQIAVGAEKMLVQWTNSNQTLEFELDCSASLSMSAFYVGAPPQQSLMHATNALFYNVTYRVDDLNGTTTSFHWNQLPEIPSIDWNAPLSDGGADECHDDINNLACSPVAMYKLGISRMKSGRWKEGIHLLNASAHLGFSSSMTELGHLYSLGFISQNSTLSNMWHSLAIARGDEVNSYLALSRRAPGRHLRLGLTVLAGGPAMSHLMEEGFRTVDYRPLDELGEDPINELYDKEHALDNDEVLEQYRYEADGGDASATASLGDVHYHGLRNVPINLDLAAKYYQQAADLGSAHGKVNLAKMHVMGQKRLPRNETLTEFLQDSLKSNNAEGVALLAHVTAHAGDTGRALQLYQEASRMPGASPSALSNIGVLMRGRNSTEARDWFRRGALLGETSAQYWYANMLVLGEGGDVDIESAQMYFSAVLRQYLLSVLWSPALDAYLASDYHRAYYEFAVASELGLAEASYDFAFMLKSKWGGGEFFPAGHQLCRHVLEDGLRNHNFRTFFRRTELALALARVLPQDEKRTVDLYEIASSKEAEAMFALGYAYHFGVGVERNSTRAFQMYWNLMQKEEHFFAEQMTGFAMIAILYHNVLIVVAILTAAVWIYSAIKK